MKRLALSLLLALPLPAFAADESVPSMDFTFQREDYRKYGLGLYQVIHARGTITDGTTEKLKIFAAENRIEPGGEIYLESTTGNRLEGMRMGRLIRSLGLMTHIGDTALNSRGICSSACAFAYLGGTFRFMNDGATFGMHRFYRSQGEEQEFTLEQAQAVSERMVGYMADMGISNRLYRYMALNGKGDVVFISKQTLKSLNVVNDGIIASGWRMPEKDGIPYLRGDLQNYKGTHSLSFHCDRQFNTMKGIAVLEASDPDSVRRTASDEGLFIGTQRLPIAGELVSSNRSVTYTFPVTPETALKMATAPDLGIYIQPNSIPYYAGFKIQQNRDSMDMMKKFINTCFGKTVIEKDNDKRY